ncbi:MAG TPA: hypothetical protein VHM70_00630 [Polyangiaceae bacterium]|jgi:hypothetical protein|nr:hypothetical protein [Polyangiaceae bacterium]
MYIPQVTLRFVAGVLLLAQGVAHADPAPTTPATTNPAAAQSEVPAPNGSAGAPTADPDADLARNLFRQAQELLKAGQTGKACETFEQSLKLVAGAGTKFNLADCWERLGRTASAQALFVEVATATRDAGQVERSQAAQARADKLSAQLSQVRLQVNEEVDGETLTLDGKPLEHRAWTSPFAVDPGKHELHGEAPNKRPWSTLVDVPGGPSVVVIVAPKFEDSAPTAAAPSPAPVEPTAVNPTEPPQLEHGSGSGRHVLTYSLAGLGVVGLAVGGTMAKQFYDSNDKAKTICPTSRNCSSEEIDQHSSLVNDARRSRTWAWGGASVGTIALLTAGLLWLTEDSNADEHALLIPVLSPDSFGALMQRRF